ncbi:MAG TPA: hypothetical protein VEH81_11320, partial [Ktedonobacteraceae bacterium]|nr:hypothetical protein [Ktedonobacteraceae bacterium]
WQWTDLSSLTGAPLLHQNSLSGYCWVWGATKQVAYMDDRGDVIELLGGFRGQWHYAQILKSAEARYV